MVWASTLRLDKGKERSKYNKTVPKKKRNKMTSDFIFPSMLMHDLTSIFVFCLKILVYKYNL